MSGVGSVSKVSVNTGLERLKLLCVGKDGSRKGVLVCSSSFLMNKDIQYTYWRMHLLDL